MEFIDTHTHLFASEFDEDIHDVIKDAVKHGVSKMLLPNIDSSTTNKMLELSQLKITKKNINNNYINTCF